MDDKLKKQIEFIVAVDKIKSIVRRTKIFDGSRLENDAEHSWHIALMAMVLHEYANEKVDLLKVIKMLLIHDIVEIYSGDIIIYTNDPQDKVNKELEGAEKVFSILPHEQYSEFIDIWKEFESRETAEAKFAAAFDRLEPVMQNCFHDGYAWVNNGIKYEQIINVNKRISSGSEELWRYAKTIIDECKDRGII